MSEHIHNPTFDEIRKIFEETSWQYEGLLPGWMSRHGKILDCGEVLKVQYDQNYFFAGHAKVYLREMIFGIKDTWNDQLFPYPLYLGVTCFPETPGSLSGLENNQELQKKFIWLSYADEYGTWSGRYPPSKRKELENKFIEVIDKYLQTPGKPNFKLKYYDDLSKETIEYVYSHGELLTSNLKTKVAIWILC